MQVDLILDGDKVVLDDFGENGEWSLEYTTVEKTYIYHDIYPGTPFPKASFNLYLKRKPGYYGLNILTPCFMIIILGNMSTNHIFLNTYILRDCPYFHTDF